jgi:hypothetical protein
MMAIVKGKECTKDVSSKAKLCPHCGVTPQNVWALRFKRIAIAFLVLTIGVVILAKNQAANDAELSAGESVTAQPVPEMQPAPELKPAPAKTAEDIAAELLACKKDIKCWGDQYNIEAASYCAHHIERLANYSFEWTDGWLEPKLSHFRWHDIGLGSVTYIGDKIKFQNGYGAWQNMIYECDYNPENEQVIDVRAEPGRI